MATADSDFGFWILDWGLGTAHSRAGAAGRAVFNPKSKIQNPKWFTRAACLALLLVGACAREQTSPASAPAADPSIACDTPQAAVESLFRLLRAHLRAMAASEPAAAGHAREQIVWHIAARPEIAARHRRVGAAADGENLGLVRKCVESWAAMIAYYADGLALDQLRMEDDGSRPKTTLRVPARGRDGDAVIRVMCVRAKEGGWRVVTLDFAEPTRATSQPTSNPTSATSR